MENKLEQLLNGLIKRGWKPRGHKAKSVEVFFSNYMNINFDDVSEECTVAEIVRKPSGLWQFVCENKLLPKKNGYVWNLIDHYNYDKSIKWIAEYNCLYYIIESSLKDESELEDFLLQSIVINND